MKSLLSFGVLLAIATAAGRSNALAADLVAHWDFEHFDDNGTTIKSTVGGYVGTVQGSPALVPISRPGGGGNGLDISGGGDGGYLVVNPATSPDNLFNKASAGNAISIIFWEKNNKSPADGCCDASSMWVESPSSAHGTRGINVHVPWSNGEIMFDTAGCCTAGTRITIAPANFDFTQWHHYAFIENDTIKQIWVDGLLLQEGTGQDPLPTDFDLAYIGANGQADGHHSPNATIDDFAVYKGALTEAEIKAIAAGAPIEGPPKAQLIAHWDFEHFDDNGTTIKSAVGGYVGTVQGSPTIVPIDRPGGGGNGLDISGGGAGGYIVVDPATSPDNMFNKAGAGNAMSFAFWEKNNKSPADGCCDASTVWVESPSSAHGTRGVNVHVPWSNGEVMFDTTGCCTAGTRITIIPANFDFTKWHHYAFVENGTVKQIWIDGTLAKEGTGQDPLPTDFDLAYIGANGQADGHHSPNAIIDEFVLYKGALSEVEIKSLAAGTTIVTPPPPDTVPPTIVSTVPSRTPGVDFTTVSETVTLNFSEEVMNPGATKLTNYSISPNLAITKAELKNGNSVMLTTAKTTPATLYTLTMNGVQDAAKNTIAANSKAQFVAFSVVTNGILRFAAWGNIDGEAIDALTSDPRYPATPDFVAAATAFDSRTVIPDESHIQYGATITGILTPTETADYDFFLKSNERSQLWLNSTGTDPAGVDMIAQESSCCKNFVEPGAPQTTASPIHLEAGRHYFIQGIYKRYTLNSIDLFQIAWRKTTDTTPAGHLEPIPGSFFTAEPTLGPSPLPPSLSISRDTVSGKLTLTWTGGGTLQKAALLNGQWTDVAGAASPYAVVVSGSAAYYRTRN